MGESGGLTATEKSPELERYRLIEPYLQGARTLSSIAAQAEVSLRTAQRWVDQYRKHGLEALATKARSDCGTRRVMSQKVVEMIEGLALEKPRIPITAIYRELTEFTERTSERLPSYQAMHRVVQAIPVSLMTLAHSGSRVYSERFDLVHRREAAKPNAIWQADHAQLKIRLLREDGVICRPWLTIVIDDYSRAIAGYYLAFDPPSVLRTCLALRQAI